LLAGLWTRISAIIAGALMLVFIVAMIQAMFRGLSPDCGCFAGAGSNPVGDAVMNALGPVGSYLANEKVGFESLIRDLVFLAMSVHLVLVPSIFSLDNLRYRSHMEALADEEAEAESLEDWVDEENTMLHSEDSADWGGQHK